jgi:hypothetical protein
MLNGSYKPLHRSDSSALAKANNNYETRALSKGQGRDGKSHDVSFNLSRATELWTDGNDDCFNFFMGLTDTIGVFTGSDVLGGLLFANTGASDP